MEILDQQHVLPFTFDTGQRAGSQLSVLARCRVELYIDVLDGNMCYCAPSQFLSSSLSLIHTNLFSFSPTSCSPFPILPFSQVLWGEVCRTTYPTNNTTPSPSTQATPTARPIQLWVQPVSSFSVWLHVSLFLPSLFVPPISLNTSLFSLSCFLYLITPSLLSISGCYYQGSSYAHSRFSSSTSLPSLYLSLPFNLSLFSHTLPSQVLLVYITSSNYLLLPSSPALSLSFTLSLPCNFICFSFIHPLHRHYNETNWGRDTFGRLPSSLSLELIAVLQSVWFDFIGAIWFFNAAFGVWLKPGHGWN